MSFNVSKMYFDEFLQPRELSGLNDLIELGLLPNLKGIYRQDYLKHTGKAEEKREIDALFISHAHADHANYIHYLREDIPIICTKETAVILRALEDTQARNAQYHTFFPKFEFYTNTKGKLSKLRKNCKEAESKMKKRTYIVLDSEKSVKIKDIEIKLVRVDHSLCGAAGCILKTSKGNIAYTGDFRFHGRNSKLTERFVEVCKDENIKYLISEGTRINETNPNTEEEIEKQASELIKKTKGLVVVSIPVRDVDRITSFLEAAKENNRIFTISMKQAYLLKLLEEEHVNAPRINDPNIRIYIPLKDWGLLNRKDLDSELIASEYDMWERDFLTHKNIVTAEEIRKNHSKYIFQCNLFEFTQLLDVQPDSTGCYIRSSTEPFDPEMELDEARILNWLNHFGLGKINQMHAGGHAPGSEIKRLIETINPEVLIPIHTVKPRLFKKNVTVRKIVYPKLGKEISIK